MAGSPVVYWLNVVCVLQVTFISVWCSSLQSPPHPTPPHLPLPVPGPAISERTSLLPTRRCRCGGVGGCSPVGGEPSRRSHRTIPEISLNLHLRFLLPRGDVGIGGGIYATGPEDGEKRRRAAEEQRSCRSDHTCAAVPVETDQALHVCSLIRRGAKPNRGFKM